jgi:hypothetical protein
VLYIQDTNTEFTAIQSRPLYIWSPGSHVLVQDPDGFSIKTLVTIHIEELEHARVVDEIIVYI